MLVIKVWCVCVCVPSHSVWWSDSSHLALHGAAASASASIRHQRECFKPRFRVRVLTHNSSFLYSRSTSISLFSWFISLSLSLSLFYGLFLFPFLLPRSLHSFYSLFLPPPHISLHSCFPFLPLSTSFPQSFSPRILSTFPFSISNCFIGMIVHMQYCQSISLLLTTSPSLHLFQFVPFFSLFPISLTLSPSLSHSQSLSLFFSPSFAQLRLYSIIIQIISYDKQPQHCVKRSFTLSLYFLLYCYLWTASPGH